MNQFNLRYVLALSFVSAMGGMLFGYDWVVIGGGKPFYELFFNFKGSPSLQGWAMSSALVGCVSGAAVAGSLSDRLCRCLHPSCRLPYIGWSGNRSCFNPFSHVYSRNFPGTDPGSFCFVESVDNCCRHTGSTNSELANRPTHSRRIHRSANP